MQIIKSTINIFYKDDRWIALVGNDLELGLWVASVNPTAALRGLLAMINDVPMME